MGYQALLFCPDEKLARVVSQVFSELDFAVEWVQEPFAAVKKLMAQRYDAIVVDCENEQNASLLFRSARNSGSNQSSLAIALVEGQAGVAKAYRIGANLVLTKPINVEQAKGTLRVARGLLRKNSDAAAASASSGAAPAMPAKTAPVPAGSSFQPASRSAAAIAPPPSAPEFPELEAPLSTTIPAAVPAQAQSATAIAAEAAEEAREPASPAVIKNDVVKNDAARIAAPPVPPQSRGSAFASVPGSAAAPAPAKEATAAPAKENKKVESEVASPSYASPSHANPSHDAAPIFASSSASASDAPSFAALGQEDSAGSGGRKKFLIAAVVILALAALGYFSSEGKLGKSSAAPTPQPASTPRDAAQPAPALLPMSSPVAAPSTSAPKAASSATQPLAPKTDTEAPLDKPSAGVGNSPVIRIAANLAADPEPATRKPDATPIVVKSNARAAKSHAPADELAPALPSPLAVASANDSGLSSLISSASSSLAKPSLVTVKISQGVSQGLLIKRVAPKYPPAALAVHAEGVVQIEATIDKEGHVTNLKVLKGDAVLAHAALEAVRQWRYKPYYLDGAPVEIQTQITVNFKAN
jgi:TonB family protein